MTETAPMTDEQFAELKLWFDDPHYGGYRRKLNKITLTLIARIEAVKAVKAEKSRLRNALLEAEKTLCVLHGQAAETAKTDQRWEGVEGKIRDQITNIREASHEPD